MVEPESVSKDPVCGMLVVKATAVHAERDEETLYFCSDDCRHALLSTPASAGAKAGGANGRGR